MKPDAAAIPTQDYNREHPLLANPGETHLTSHLPQLDGVRAIAVLLVLWHHFAPVNPGPLGAVGVGLFFVLSGFLITRILLNCKLRVDDGKSTTGQMLRQFYIRRFLRIFPLYYGVIAVLFAVNYNEGFRERVGWHLAYLSNVLFSLHDYPRGAVPAERHFWSLAVEEQFYLVWPFVILFTPRRFIPWAIALAIAIGPAWRIVVQWNEWNWGLSKRSLMDQWMTPGCLDLLGMGALLALLSLPQYGLSRYWRAFVETSGVIGIPLLIIYITMAGLGDLPWTIDATPYLPTALAGACLVGLAARGFAGPVGWVLQCRPMVYTGRISYGLYVLHMFVPALFSWALVQLGMAGGMKELATSTASLFASTDAGVTALVPWMKFAYATLATYVVATASWYAFEAPINGLKRHFEYDAKRKSRDAPGDRSGPPSP
jgi:peptidoglycan/LPS O-acetylase OafA/YrhL